MPLRLQKTETENQLLLERVHHAKRYALVVDKGLCVGCEICKTVCPREAIKVTKAEKRLGEKTPKPTIDIDLDKCDYCGICNSICPFGAVTVLIDGKNLLSVVEKESFPELIREIKVDPTKCDSSGTEYDTACPLNLIKVTFHTPDGKQVENPNELSEKEKKNLKPEITIKQDRCPCCRICELDGPSDAIQVKPIFNGALRINEAKCPEGCRDCLDVCPIKGALYMSEDGKKVKINEPYCVYCGACRIACPVEGALDLQRTSVRHTPVKSGAWNKALEKLASTKGIAKELRAKGAAKAKEAVDRRFEGRQQE
ncbi:MAG TPA: 4Fe-4S dicluster domain-containing protein [Candidatus Krumholzibacteriaceae bacterium]|nr:4Fe-4S dicluster domain-containing protein [Candidatus Krumholzibacteriaceae bacterium]